MENFASWINAELNKRGWSRSEAARRGEISNSMFSKVIGGFANPGIEFCRGVSRAFGVPMEDVLQLAGILPSKPAVTNIIRQRRVIYEVNGLERLAELWQGLSVEDQQRMLDLMERLQMPMEPRIIGKKATNAE